ncbi:MAG: GNAT family N-acetyltransferase [Geminicoccaceae bacterium]
MVAAERRCRVGRSARLGRPARRLSPAGLSPGRRGFRPGRGLAARDGRRTGLDRPAAAAAADRGAPGRTDATSVYGYAGPITSAAPVAPDLVAGFHRTLRQGLVERGAVTLFARLHPLLEQLPQLVGMGELERLGDTVSIDLRQPPAAQLGAYRSNHRRDLARLERRGYRTTITDNPGDLAAFAALYHENMRRVHARPQYFFDAAYFDRLALALGPALALASCHQDGQLVGGALFMRHGPFVQYHLGAVSDRHVAAAPAKQLIDAARRHFHAAGAELLHLGGGRGAAEDSLFHFKAGFSPRRHAFRVWRWIIDADTYGRLAEGKPATDFFPAYRG